MKQRYRNLSFFAEVIVNIIVFSLSCAILASVFVKAASVNKNNREETQAVTQLYSLFQEVQANGTQSIAPARQTGADNWVIEYDKNWNAATGEDVVYTVEFSLSSDERAAGTLYTMQGVARRQKDGEVFCRLESSFYTPRQGGAST